MCVWCVYESVCARTRAAYAHSGVNIPVASSSESINLAVCFYWWLRLQVAVMTNSPPATSNHLVCINEGENHHVPVEHQ